MQLFSKFDNLSDCQINYVVNHNPPTVFVYFNLEDLQGQRTGAKSGITLPLMVWFLYIKQLLVVSYW